jgi:hypothetical protein
MVDVFSVLLFLKDVAEITFSVQNLTQLDEQIFVLNFPLVLQHKVNLLESFIYWKKILYYRNFWKLSHSHKLDSD